MSTSDVGLFLTGLINGDYKLYNSHSDHCDSVDGPCSCGAWHSIPETIERIRARYGKLELYRVMYSGLPRTKTTEGLSNDSTAT